MNPADAESTYQLGVLYDRNGRTEEGEKLLRRAITLRANYPDPHYQLGRIALSARITRPRWRSWSWRGGCCRTRRRSGMALGRVYQALGRAAEAKAEFAEVRRLKAAVIERDRQRVESDALMKP